MTAIPARRVGTLPRPSTHPTADVTGFAGLFDLKLPRAACKGTAPLMDATVPTETPEEKAQRHERAKALCRICPEMTACLRARLADDSLGEGIWAGQLFGPSQTSTCRNPHCDTVIDLTHRVYCSRPCRQRVATVRKTKAPQRDGTCQNIRCQNSFTTTQPRQRYCSHRCQRAQQQRHLRARHSARAAA